MEQIEETLLDDCKNKDDEDVKVKAPKKSIFKIVTDLIIKKLNKGVIPWRQPWTIGGFPRNAKTLKDYNGINVFLLSIRNFRTNYWITKKQAESLGGKIKDGENPHPIIFFKRYIKPSKMGKQNNKPEFQTFSFFKTYEVFNIDQSLGLEWLIDKFLLETHLSNFKPVEKCEEIIFNYKFKPKIAHEADKAFYWPLDDVINMPNRNKFISEAEYYSTLFHELIHSTGHKSRLNRKGVRNFKPFGSHEYSKEELTAEMGSCFLCAMAGIETQTLDNSAAYVGNWLWVLKNDQNLVLDAAFNGKSAVNFMIGDQCRPNV